MRVSSTCLVRVDRNRYSIPASAAGQAVSVRTTAEQVRVVAHGEVIAAHPRAFGRDQLICDPWHYLPVLEKKPGALPMVRHSWRGACPGPSGSCVTVS